MNGQIDEFDVISIVEYMEGIQTDQFHQLVMDERDLDLYNPNALKQIVRCLKELEEYYDDEREVPRVDFSRAYSLAEELIEALENVEG